jgi:dTDP-glucose 4,6-dehydratase
LDRGLRETVRWYIEHREWADDVRSGEYRRWMETNYGARRQSEAGKA